jgi:RNA polymerase sigma-70 factor (ECF subfamily)
VRSDLSGESGDVATQVETGVWDVSDEAMLAGYATGDADMAVVFVRRFQARVFGLALMITRDRTEADEVAQDAFVRAWRYARSFDARRGTVSGWLLGITRNAAVDRMRMAGNRRERFDLRGPDELGIDLAVDDEAPRTAERHEALAQVARSLRSLPDPQREALVAVTLRGLSTREYAEAAEIPLGTAKTRVRLGLRRLRDALEVEA